MPARLGSVLKNAKNMTFFALRPPKAPGGRRKMRRGWIGN
jgi:hypothetical protein